MAITATALPAYANQIVIATNATTPILAIAADAVTQVTGKLESDALDFAITLDTAATAGELDLAATVVLSGVDAVAGFDVGNGNSSGLNNAADNDAVNGNLTHSGSISVSNNKAAAIRIANTVIGGDLKNTGTLAVVGDETHGIKLTGANAVVNGSLSNGKDATITATGKEAVGIYLNAAKIGKDLFNAGTLTADGEKAMAIALTGKAEIAGNLVNGTSGVITAKQDGAIGISVADATVKGSLSNNGTLTTDGAASKGIELGAAGVIAQDLVNDVIGTIKVEQAGSIGISLLGQSKIDGSLINSGHVGTNGDNTKAINLATGSIIGKDLSNTGRISVTGDNTAGISLSGMISESLINNGTIDITGNNAKAIELLTDGAITKDLHLQDKSDIIVKGENGTGISLAATVTGDLVSEGQVAIHGTNAKGIVLGANSHVNNLNILSGTISASALDANATAMAISLEGGEIAGSLLNQGLIGASGMGATAISLATENSTIAGNVHNDKKGTIIAQGQNANGIHFNNAVLTGKLVNDGDIQVEGEGASAIKTTGPNTAGTGGKLASLENSGTVSATGKNSFGLNIEGGDFTQLIDAGPQILNTGSIKAEGTAIHIGADVFTAGAKTDPLHIHNSGTLIGGVAAVDATTATLPVHLTLNDGSKVQGLLNGLTELNVKGDTQFTGKTNITMATNGAINVGDAQGEGHLSLEQAHSTFNGNLNVAKDSSLILSLSDATKANEAILAVTGTATFDATSKIKVNASGRDFADKGNTYTLLTSTGLLTADAAIVDVQSSSALLNITNKINAATNTITSQVAVKSGAEIAEMVGKLGATHNSQAALVNLAGDSILSKMPVGDAVLAAFSSADAAQLAVLAKQLTPEVGGGAAQAATGGQALVANVTGGRTSAVRGMASGEASKQTGIWAQSLNSDATQGMRDGIDGYNAKSNGMAFGADAKINDQVTLGVAYSHLNTDVNSKSGNKTKVDGHAFTLYGGYELGNVFIDGGLTYGLNDNESKRTIAGTQAKANYDSDLLGLNLTAGYTYRITPQLLAEPQLTARYSQVNIDGYREKGSSAALAVEKQRHEAIELGAGVRVAGNFPLGKGTLEPSVKVMAFHDFAASETTSTSTFVLGNTPFVTSGPNATRNSFEVGVGADYKLGAVTLGLNYDYVGKTGFDADTVTAKVRYDF